MYICTVVTTLVSFYILVESVAVIIFIVRIKHNKILTPFIIFIIILSACFIFFLVINAWTVTQIGTFLLHILAMCSLLNRIDKHYTSRVIISRVLPLQISKQLMASLITCLNRLLSSVINNRHWKSSPYKHTTMYVISTHCVALIEHMSRDVCICYE